jgi:hypothetical protein
MMTVIPPDLNWVFTAQDLLNNALALYTSVAGFVMLSLAVAFAPRLVAFIRDIVTDVRTVDDEDEDRDE